jgi:hypothetical protein
VVVWTELQEFQMPELLRAKRGNELLPGTPGSSSFSASPCGESIFLTHPAGDGTRHQKSLRLLHRCAFALVQGIEVLALPGIRGGRA